MNSITDTNPEHDEKTCEGNDAKSKVACFTSYSPKSRRECMDGEYLVDRASVR